MRILLSLIFYVSHFICEAQEIMPRLGVAMTTANIPGAFDGYNTSFAPGFVTGVEAWFPIRENAGIAGDLLFSQKGWRSEVNGIDFKFQASQRIFYGELICLPYYRWSVFYFMAGPGLLYGLTGRTNETLTRFDGSGTNSYQHSIHFDNRTTGSADYYVNNRITFGGTLCAGVMLWELLLIDLRYQISSFGTSR
jgi:opacity protein-like surface antigen